MGLVVAIILIFVLMARMGSEKLDDISLNMSKAERERRIREFEQNFTSLELEKNINAFRKQHDNRAVIDAELSIVANSLQHWNAYSLREYETDILMANRGYAAYGSGIGYYEAAEHIVNGKTLQEREKYFELMEWIRGTLRKQGKDVELVLMHGNKVGYHHKLTWVNSSGYVYGATSHTPKPFDRSLIEREEFVLPKPYYDVDNVDIDNAWVRSLDGCTCAELVHKIRDIIFDDIEAEDKLAAGNLSSDDVAILNKKRKILKAQKDIIENKMKEMDDK